MKQLFDEFRGLRALSAPLIALAALFIIAGCGGGDSTGSGTDNSSAGTNASAPAITKVQLIKKADAICRKTDGIQRKAFNAYSVKNKLVLAESPEMRKVMKTILLPPIGVELKEISALGMPAGDEAELTTIMTGWERALDAALEDPSLVISGGDGPFIPPDKLAAKYGFKDCDLVL